MSDSPNTNPLEELDNLTNALESQLPDLIKHIEHSSENNIKFINLMQESLRSQNDNMNYLEKKLEFIDKTIELKTKHFDEIIKANMEHNDNLVQTVQASLHNQVTILNIMQSNVNSMKYWLVLIIIAMGGLVWGINAHFYNLSTQRTGMPVGNMGSGFLTSVQEDNHRLINKIQEDNKVILATIQKDNKLFLNDLAQSTNNKVKELQDNTQKFVGTMQKENREMLTTLQQANQEHLTTIINTLRSGEQRTTVTPKGTTPPPPPAAKQQGKRSSTPVRKQQPSTKEIQEEPTAEPDQSDEE